MQDIDFSSGKDRDLRSIFCERFGCAPAEYEQRALRKCLYLHARLAAPLLRWLNPGRFKRDLLFIHYLGNATNLEEAAAEVFDLRYEEGLQPRFARKTLRLRVSGRKASKLALLLFRSSRAVQAPPEAISHRAGLEQGRAQARV